MQPLQLLDNVQKARLLHSLLRAEIPEFLAYLNEMTETVLNTKEQLLANWDNQLFTAEMWFELADEVQRKMAKYQRELYQSPNLFAEQLFGGYLAMFSNHALAQYVAEGRHSDPKFKQAVDLLFT